MAGYEGYAALGEMLTGGGQSDGTAYVDALRQGSQARREGFSADKAFEEARIARMMANARESIPSGLGTAEYDPKLAPLLGAVLQSNQTMNLGQLGQYERPGAGQAFADAEAAMRAGNLGEANALNAAGLGEAYEPFSAVAGGKAVLRGDTGEIALTDLGDASVAAESALAGSRNAAAEAALIRANKPPAAKPAESSGRAAALKQAKAAIARGADRAKVAARLAELGYPDAEGEL